jgi:hypothetical protein
VRISGIAVFFVGCAMIAGCSRKAPDMEVRVRSRLLNFAGGIDCGRATTREEYSAATACAKNALGRGMPFFVQYRFTEVDIGGEEGLARNDKGQFLEAYYAVSDEGSRFGTRTCSKTQVAVLPDGSFGCEE